MLEKLDLLISMTSIGCALRTCLLRTSHRATINKIGQRAIIDRC